MKALAGRVLGLFLVLLSPAAMAETQSYRVIVGGTVVGHLRASIEADTVSIDYDYKNNGRGPTLVETIELDGGGLPRRWTLSGSTTFGGKIDERFERDETRARWLDSVGEASVAWTQPALYVAQSASPWAMGLYARALLANGGEMPALPAGRLRLQAGDAVDATGKQGALKLSSYALTGLDLNPSYFLLDQQQALFAYITPRFIVIREGFETEDARLRGLAAEWSAQRLQSLQEKTAHRYAQPVRIQNVRLFDPHARALTAPVAVLVHGNEIAGVVPMDSPATAGEVLIDGEGGSLIAGLFEMHGHLSQEAAMLNIAAGVTSIRDMGNDNAVLSELIRRIEAETIAGPRVIRSGFIEGKSPFSSNNGILVETQAQAIDAVRWYAARGFWQVKLYNSMNPQWANATVAEAHRLGLRVAGHVPAFSTADAMIDAGFDELTHINQIMLGWVLQPEEDTRSLLRLTALRRLPTLDLDSDRVRGTIEHIVAKKVAVEPTIAIHESLLLNRDGQTPPGQADIIEHLPIGAQRSAKRTWVDLSEAGDDAAYRAAYTTLLTTLKAMRARGILLIPGTDLGGSFAFHRELELFQEIGMSAADVLKLASYDMARYTGREQRLGSIEKGKLADFFLVPGDPTKDLKAIKQIRMVVKNGSVYFPAEIYPHFGIRPFATTPPVHLPEKGVKP